MVRRRGSRSAHLRSICWRRADRMSILQLDTRELDDLAPFLSFFGHQPENARSCDVLRPQTWPQVILFLCSSDHAVCLPDGSGERCGLPVLILVILVRPAHFAKIWHTLAGFIRATRLGKQQSGPLHHAISLRRRCLPGSDLPRRGRGHRPAPKTRAAPRILASNS
jgi:hypothetical protein